jgi:DeoR/GlpR family transcriptional regulator of sugar metabolism
MIESANEIYLVADSTKIGKNSFASLGALSLIDYLITDSKIKQEDIEWLKTYDVQFIIAE